MTTIKNKNFYISLAKELDSKLGRINSLIGQHRGQIGNYHEYVLRDLIEKFLPKRYSIKTGFIYVDDDHVSPQIDLMVIDEAQTPHILAQYDNFAIVYPEAVSCVIEVKTKLDSAEFVKAAKLIQEVKKLSIYNKKADIIGGLIFAFGGTRFTPSKIDEWYKLMPKCDISEYPEALLSLRTGLLLKKDITKPTWGHYFVTGDGEGLKWKSLSIMLSMVIKYCELRAGINTTEPGKIAFDRYAYMEEIKTSAQYFRYHEGMLSAV